MDALKPAATVAVDAQSLRSSRAAPPCGTIEGSHKSPVAGHLLSRVADYDYLLMGSCAAAGPTTALTCLHALGPSGGSAAAASAPGAPASADAR